MKMLARAKFMCYYKVNLSWLYIGLYNEKVNRKMNASIVFMAAGFGTRFSGGVKQIAPVGPNGEVLMDYAVYDALKAGFNRVIFIIRRDLEADFRRGVGHRVEKKCDVEYVFQDVKDLPAGFEHMADRRKPWGTGQAVLACRNVLHEPFCVLNADDYYGADALRKVYDHLAHQQTDGRLDLCMMSYRLGNTLSESGAVTRGLCEVDAQGRLRALRETKNVVLENGVSGVRQGESFIALDPKSPVSMNLWGMPACFIAYLQDQFPLFLQKLGNDYQDAEYLLPTVVGDMAAAGKGTVHTLSTDEKWFGMTYAEDKLNTQQRIRELIRLGVYPERL